MLKKGSKFRWLIRFKCALKGNSLSSEDGSVVGRFRQVRSSVPDEQKEEMELTFKEDGEFLMSLELLKKYFDDAEICDLYRQMRKTLKTGPT